MNFFPALFHFLLPPRAFAQDVVLDPCAGGGTGVACVTSNLEIGAVLGGVINMIFVIAVIAALGFLVWGGFKWLTSGGDKEGVEGARNTIIAAIVGLILIFLSYVILNLVLIFLGYPEGLTGIEITSIIDGAGGGAINIPSCALGAPVSNCICDAPGASVVNGICSP